MPSRRFIFISNTDLLYPKGGWDGYGGKIHDIVSRHYPGVRLIDKLNPPMGQWPRIRSKLLRMLGIPANFPSYAAPRLDAFAQLVKDRLDDPGAEIVFHGATPWLHYRPVGQYHTILDCCFKTYIKVYHDARQYSEKEIARISGMEKQFLERASTVFFTTQWGIDEACREYGLSGQNMVCSGLFSTMKEGSIPVQDLVGVKNQFLMIASDFLGKGGAAICNSFQKLVKTHDRYRLLIIGDRPPEEFLEGMNVEYLGYIDKSSDEGHDRINTLYRESTGIVYLTKKDIAPLVIIEGALQGCPSISNRTGGIPDTIEDGVTGYLIENSEDAMYEGMMKMVSLKEDVMLAMRRNAQAFASGKFSIEQTSSKVIRALSRDGR
jgi:glycosyltransferase involved in cell wall biosynthesis